MDTPKTREQLATYFFEQGLIEGAEIGVEQGKYTEVLCKAGLKVNAIDWWRSYKGYRDHVSQNKLDGFFEATKERVKGYDCRLIRQNSANASRMFADESLDWVYIDANHSFKFIAEDLHIWGKKVKKGGIVAGHDYREFGGSYGLNANHVKYVVDAWAKSNKIDNLKITDGDKTPSWYYVK